MTMPETTAPAPGRTIARLLADALVATGVDIAFTVPGESFLPLLDALETRGIRVVAARHEGGAAFMAEAWGQLTGRPAAVLGTRAVGAANMAIGVVTARADSTPMVAIVGQVHRDRLGREAFQEADVAGSVGRLAKWAVEVRDVEVAPGAIEEALHRAVDGRPGPVMIVVPEDVFVETTADMRFAGSTRPPERRAPEPPLSRVSAALRMLAAAERPVIIAGVGVLRSRGTRDLVRLAETLEIPVIASWRRGDAFPNDHRLYLGMSGFGAPETVRRRLVEADALLVLGSRLNEVTTFGYTVPAPGARWAHVDREPRAADEDGTGWPGHLDHGRRRLVPARRAPRGHRRGPRQGRLRRSARAQREGQGRVPRRLDRHGRRGRDEGRPSRPGGGCPPGRAAAHGAHHHRRGQLRRLDRPRVPVPPARDVPRADVGRDGVRAPCGDRSRGAGAGPRGGRGRRGRRLRDDDGGARDGRPAPPAGDRGRLRRSALRDDPGPPGPGRARDGRDGPRRGRLRRRRARAGRPRDHGGTRRGRRRRVHGRRPLG